MIGFPDRDYAKFVTEYFSVLHRKGLFSLKQKKVPFHRPSGRYLFESYAQGRCNFCFAKTKGNICENCGHPNEPHSLLGLHATGYEVSNDAISVHILPTLVIEIERYRSRILNHLDVLESSIRLGLARLCRELLEEPLPDFPVTFPSKWGIPAPFAGLSGSVINVWAEMQPGHIYWLSEAWRKSNYYNEREIDQQNFRYIQFLGFDNSFFYAFAHMALAFAARDAGLFAPLPDAFVTNEFYQLDNYKFSTSQGHLIWARDLLAEELSDEVRFYLCWSNPEYQKANFTHSDMHSIVGKYFRDPVSEILRWIEQRVTPLSHVSTLPDVSVIEAAIAVQRRLEAAFEARTMSVRCASQALIDVIDWCVDIIQLSEESGDQSANIRCLLNVLAPGLAPIAPATATRLWQACGNDAPISWPSVRVYREQSHSIIAAE